MKANELQRTGPVAVARAEAAWLHGDRASVRDIALPVYQEAVGGRLGDQVHQAELGYWLARAGQRVQSAGDHPYAVQAAGRWREAATLWESAGCPYEQATALSESHDPEHMLTALGMLDALAAKPLATKVRRRLRALGVALIPRGPLIETRVNPAGVPVGRSTCCACSAKASRTLRLPASSWFPYARSTVTWLRCSASSARPAARRPRSAPPSSACSTPGISNRLRRVQYRLPMPRGCSPAYP